MFHRPLAALLAVFALVFAGCGGDSESSAPEQPTSSAVVETLPAEEFPVTVEADNGPVTIEEEPEAIVSLSATATESLFAMGAGEQVLAVDDQSNFPAEAPVTDLSGFEPNVEAIAGYEPDLVIAAYDPGGLVDGPREARHPRAPAGRCARPRRRLRADRDARRRDRERRGRRVRGHVHAGRDRRARRLRSRRCGCHRLPRARPGLLLGHLGDVHRQRLRALRAREHRRRRRPTQTRAAIRS